MQHPYRWVGAINPTPCFVSLTRHRIAVLLGKTGLSYRWIASNAVPAPTLRFNEKEIIATAIYKCGKLRFVNFVHPTFSRKKNIAT